MRQPTQPETNKKKKKLHLPLSAYLSYLLIATLIFTGVSFSKYASTTSGNADARVACMITAATGARLSDDDIVDDLNQKNDSYRYQVTVTNTQDGQISEVSLQYTLYIVLPEDFPPMEITVTEATMDETNSTPTLLVYNGNETFSAGVSATYTHTITIQTTEETRGFYENLPVTFYVKAEQID